MESNLNLGPVKRSDPEPHHDQHGYLGRTGANYDIRANLRMQSATETCACEVLDENTGARESHQEHTLRDPDYGEPLKTQCLRIDFTPIPGLDDDSDRLEKVTMFWNYIGSCRQLNRLMVLPDKVGLGPSDESTSGASSIPEPDVDGIQWIQNPATSFKLQTMAKLPGTKYCPQEGVTDDYEINDENFKFKDRIAKLAPMRKPSCSEIKACYCKKTTDTYTLCQVMDDFDKKNPKSMEPPGHPPPLSYAYLQRVHSTVALPSEKHGEVHGCDCPKPNYKSCHCCGRESVADLWSVRQLPHN